MLGEPVFYASTCPPRLRVFSKGSGSKAEPPFLSVEGEMAAEASAGGWVDGIMIFKFKTDLSGRPPNQSPDLKFPFARRGRQARK